MKINFDWQDFMPKKETDKVPIDRSTYQEDRVQGKNYIQNQTILDISGKVTDDFSYGDQGRLAENLTKALGSKDYVAVQRDLMTVMSNSMSTEDFQKMKEDGYDIGNMDAEAVVTILDKIKAVLAQSGTTIAGYNDTLSVDKLAEITGSRGYADEIAGELKQADVPVTEENVKQVWEAARQASELTAPKDGSVAYLLNHGMEPTLSNLYKAEHSSMERSSRGLITGYTSGGYSRQGVSLHESHQRTVLSAADYGKLNQQIQDRIEAAGLEVTETTLADGTWLLEQGLPVTSENLQGLHELREITFPLNLGTVIRQAATAIGEGNSPFDIRLSHVSGSIYEQAAQLMEQVNELPPEAADYVVHQGLEFNIRSLGSYQIGVFSGSIQIEARRTLEEVRLKMTVEANVKLLRSGFSIDTAPMEDLLRQLDLAAKHRDESLFGTEESSKKGALFAHTMEQMALLPKLPVAVMGRVSMMEGATISTVVSEGKLLQASYLKVQESYEAIMTAPRADMGDNIRKAFRNVDAILEDMELELSEENRRAVRIAGYNRMELTEENLSRIREADAKVRDIMEAMKPGVTLEMIREGKNPLEMELGELQDYLASKQNDFIKDTEKYSEFLYKLDKTGGITSDEREAFIGVYRLLRQVEKSDGAVIGSLLAQNAQLNFSNLLSSVRSRKAKHTDIRVDDSVGTLEELNAKGSSISEQIQKIREIEADEKLQKEYAASSIKEIQEFAKTVTTEQEYLEKYNQPVTLEALQSVSVLTKKRGYTFQEAVRREEELALSSEEDSILSLAEQFVDKLEQEEVRETSYEQMAKHAGEVMEQAAMAPDLGVLDLKEIQSVYKQLRTAVRLSKEENYEIPVDIGGEITSINLTIVHSKESRGNVRIRFETQRLGKVEARFTEYPDGLEGSILTDYMDGKELLEERSEALSKAIEEALTETGLQVKSLFFGVHETLDINSLKEDGGGSGGEISVMYKVAKEFIRYIKGI